MSHPNHSRTVTCMTATAVPNSCVPAPTVQLGSRGQRHGNTLNRHLAAILLAVVAAAFFVFALTAQPSTGTPQPHAPAVGHPGPPSSEEILSRQNHQGSEPAAPRSAPARQ
jgi:hypothetical protein